MTQFIVVPSADVNAAGEIQSMAGAILSNGNVITVPGGVYRAFATADISVLFTPTGSNFTPGPTVIAGASSTQFLIVPDANITGGVVTTLAESFVSTNLTVTGLLSGRPYRAITLTAPSTPINTVAAPDAFTDADWNITNPARGGILDFTFTAVPYDGGSPLTNIYLYRDGSPTPIVTGLTAPGAYSDSGLTNGQSYSYTAAAVNAAGVSGLSPAKAKTPTAPVIPPITNEQLVDGLATGATPCGVQVPIAGMKKVGVDPLPAGISYATDYVSFDSFTGDFYDPQGWDFGDRLVIMNSRFGAFGNVYSLNQRQRLLSQSANASSPGILINPGGGFDLMENVTSEGSTAPMVLKQEAGGSAGIIRRCHFFGMQQDAIKVTGGTLIEENMLGAGWYLNGLPHSDTLTIMAALNGVTFRNNYVDWRYSNQASQGGINDWFRFEAYSLGNIFDDIEIYGNRLHHSNSNSFAIQVDSKNSPVWRGSIKFSNNRMQKAGALRTLLYAPSAHITEWNNNIDLNTGLVIPLSAT